VTAVVFDLDDTLYEEKGPKVAAECAVAAGLAGPLDMSIADALAVFLEAKRDVLKQRDLGPARNERQRWISHALVAHGADDGRLAEELEAHYWVALLDNVRPYADAVIALPPLAERFDLWIATNEHRRYQELKLERLGSGGSSPG
jgi:FMN phosphatase YigB (HAD superfamily)